MKQALALLCFLFLVGCAAPEGAGRVATVSPQDAIVVDSRTPDQRASRRDSNFSAIAFVGDERLSLKTSDFFAQALISQAGPNVTRPLRIEIEQLRIVDFFPGRLGAIGQGWLGHLIFQSLIDSNTDWSFVDGAGIKSGADSVVCVFVGRINGVPVKVATSEPYKISPFAVLIVNDPDFRRALDVAVKRAASQSLSRATN